MAVGAEVFQLWMCVGLHVLEEAFFVGEHITSTEADAIGVAYAFSASVAALLEFVHAGLRVEGGFLKGFAEKNNAHERGRFRKYY